MSSSKYCNWQGKFKGRVEGFTVFLKNGQRIVLIEDVALYLLQIFVYFFNDECLFLNFDL